MATEKQNKKVTLAAFGVELVIGDEYVILKRRGSNSHFTLPTKLMCAGPDRGTSRPHVTEDPGGRGRYRRKRLKRWAIDAITHRLMPVTARGTGAWPGAVKLRREDFTRFGRFAEKLIREWLFAGAKQINEDDLENDFVFVEMMSPSGMRRLWKAMVSQAPGRFEFGRDVAELERLCHDLAEEGEFDLQLPEEAIRTIGEIHDLTGSRSVMMFGYCPRKGMSADELMAIEDLDDLDRVRLFHHRYPNGREIWQLVPELDRDAARAFVLGELGTGLLTAAQSVLEALGFGLLDSYAPDG